MGCGVGPRYAVSQHLCNYTVQGSGCMVLCAASYSARAMIQTKARCTIQQKHFLPVFYMYKGLLIAQVYLDGTPRIATWLAGLRIGTVVLTWPFAKWFDSCFFAKVISPAPVWERRLSLWIVGAFLLLKF